jgi:hypothetical protein
MKGLLSTAGVEIVSELLRDLKTAVSFRSSCCGIAILSFSLNTASVTLVSAADLRSEYSVAECYAVLHDVLKSLVLVFFHAPGMEILRCRYVCCVLTG